MVPSHWDHFILGIWGNINKVLSTLETDTIIGSMEINKDSEMWEACDRGL